eukprot:6873731-Heterocapsa_arctica.AAC.1
MMCAHVRAPNGKTRRVTVQPTRDAACTRAQASGAEVSTPGLSALPRTPTDPLTCSRVRGLTGGQPGPSQRPACMRWFEERRPRGPPPYSGSWHSPDGRELPR